VNTSISRRRSAQVIGLAAVLVLVLILVVWLMQPEPEPQKHAQTQTPSTPAAAAQHVTRGSTLKPKPCYRGATARFTPTRITVPGVTRDAEVLALGRDAENVPQAPAVSTEGKTQFAWAKEPDKRPGNRRGNVLLNAHTWPDGTALGNHLLEGLEVGGRIVVHGESRDGTPQTLCYQVTKKDVIVASDGSYEYYDRYGPPQIALIVCSPPRLGPGNWLHRTIWYASPMA
jgi:hypothetical protein